MLLTLHVAIALSSVVFSTVGLFKPSERKQYISYGLMFGTLFSGILLVVFEPATMLRACTTGVAYFIAVSIIVLQTQHKLAGLKQESER